MNIEYSKYLKSKEWLSIRLDILTIRPKCERCGSKKSLEVHHLTYKRIFNEEPEDLEVLCKGCHYKEHESEIRKKNKKPVKVKGQKKRRSLAQKVLDKKKRKKINARKLYKHLKFK
jgi:5-methylcytosine-specific restriction endonuclease McrA